MDRYQAVFLDLFDTVVRFETTRLPTVRIGDREHPSTTDLLFDEVSPHAPGLDRAEFRRALRSLLATLREEKRVDHREISSDERFRRLLVGLGADAPGLAERLTDRHMEALTGCVLVPEGHPQLLADLRARFHLVLVSNFDCARHGRSLLVRTGLDRLFDAVVISDEVGWLKPHPSLFLGPASALGLAADAVLFVGDTPETDVLGAARSGMDSGWLNPRGEPFPEGLPGPTYEIRSLLELRRILLRP
ncbi:HAD family hydrolase [Myxococcota bacterium]|nr:HAD family hydrolase [Myxococcota bacterium]